MPRTSSSLRRKALPVFVSLALGAMALPAIAEQITVLHVGDQESWLISAQGNLRDSSSQAISYYGGVDRLATVIANAKAAADTAGKSVITLNAGDAFLPGPRFTASLENLATAYADGGQDFYDAIANRQIGFDAIVFGNHEFDLDNTGPIAARFAEVSGSTYLSVDLDFGATAEFAALQAAGKVAPSKIITTKGGKKIAVVGATTPLLPSISSPADGIMKNWSEDNTEAHNLAAIVPLIQAEVDRLRNNEGVTMVILMSHLQNAQNEIGAVVPALRNVNMVISGGGHELMTDADDKLINGGVAATYATHPVYATDADGKQVPVVTGHFGNRYVGEVENFTIDDSTGLVTSLDSTRMIRVSGAIADADKVDGDATIKASVVTPVLNYISALNAQIIGTSAVALNGPTHAACSAAPCEYTEGVRNAETGLGDLVQASPEFWANSAHLDAVVEIAERLAQHFKDRGRELGAYEFLNEPLVRENGKQSSPDAWPALMLRLVKAVRKHDPKRHIVLTPGFGGETSYYAKLDKPLPFDRIIYGAHFYNPHEYTHQGIRSKNSGKSWPGYMGIFYWDKERLRKQMSPLIEFRKKYDVPVLVGEFSAVRWAPGASQWICDAASLFDENGFGWMYFAFNGYHGWNPHYDTVHSSDSRADFESHRVGDQSERWQTLRAIYARQCKP